MRVVAVHLLCTLLILSPASAQERSSEQITVERIILDAHVTDSHGAVIPALTTADFEVRIGGRVAEIDAVDFVAFDRSSETVPPRKVRPDEPARTVAGGRMIILFFQTDFARQRAQGQMKILPHLDELIDTIEPYDRVAVVQHDSHLRVRQDFTSDHARLKKAIRATLSIGGGDPPDPVPDPSILEELDGESMRNAASPEEALLLLGETLQRFEGPKTMLMLGWGLGRYTSSGVVNHQLYAPARAALERSRTSVFVLDISHADYHSLEVALVRVAEDTGGFYLKTHLFPTTAMARFRNTIEGRYEIAVKRPPGAERGRTHAVQIQVKRRGTVVLAPREVRVD